MTPREELEPDRTASTLIHPDGGGNQEMNGLEEGLGGPPLTVKNRVLAPQTIPSKIRRFLSPNGPQITVWNGPPYIDKMMLTYGGPNLLNFSNGTSI